MAAISRESWSEQTIISTCVTQPYEWTADEDDTLREGMFEEWGGAGRRVGVSPGNLNNWIGNLEI